MSRPGRLVVISGPSGVGKSTLIARILKHENCRLAVSATTRGKRLDETKPGSGLGLSIVTDLVQLYHGAFRLDRSPLGGLRAAVELPAG